MEVGTGLSSFIKKYPDKYIDVGIAEEHAVTYAAGLAASGLIPIVCIYSTFMQRAFDCIFHDVLLQDLPVIFCMDRAGIVGPDGPTHHGVFDISMLNILPNIIITAPKDGDEFLNLLHTAVQFKKPFAIRYPKSSTSVFNVNRKPEFLPIGSWEYIWKVPEATITILAVGSMVSMIVDGKEKLEKNINCKINLINCRYIKPLDLKILESIISEYNLCHNVITIEEGSLIGGFGSRINDYFMNSFNKIKVASLGIPDSYIEHGSRQELLDEIGLDINGVIEVIKVITNER